MNLILTSILILTPSISIAAACPDPRTQIPKNELDVTRCGASPDDTVDDTPAIQAAISTVESSGGGIVYLPSGTYRITRALLISKSGITLKGACRSCTILETDSSQTPGFSVIKRDASIGWSKETSDWETSLTSVKLMEFTIRVRAPRSGMKGIDFSGISYSSVKEVSVFNKREADGSVAQATVGFYGRGGAGGHSPYYNEVEAFYFGGGTTGDLNSSVGIWLNENGSRGPNANRFRGGRIAACDVGVRIMGHGNVFRDLIMESIRKNHYELGTLGSGSNLSAHANLISGSYHEGSDGSYLVWLRKRVRANTIEPGKLTSIGGPCMVIHPKSDPESLGVEARNRVLVSGAEQMVCK